MAKQEFARAQAGVRMPEEPPAESLFDGPPEPPARDWLDLPPRPEVVSRYGDRPYDHAPVLLTPDGERWVEAQWQVSRRVTRARWEAYGFWAERGTGGRPVGFEPIGWKALPR